MSADELRCQNQEPVANEHCRYVPDEPQRQSNHAVSIANHCKAIFYEWTQNGLAFS
jgi:hypothetical protein